MQPVTMSAGVDLVTMDGFRESCVFGSHAYGSQVSLIVWNVDCVHRSGLVSDMWTVSIDLDLWWGVLPHYVSPRPECYIHCHEQAS